MKKVILTGDRPTGPLHLGHYVGSLENRKNLQDDPLYDPFIIIADIQALTDNYQEPARVRDNVAEVAKDYVAVGINPKKTTIFIQSMIPQIAELTVLFMNLVKHSRLLRNPTVKEEIRQKGYGDMVTAGFVNYPISQAADILFCKGEVVPVGKDQEPMIEQAREIARSFNNIYGEVFPEPDALLSTVSRLPGISGTEKMSKSLGNAIYLAEPTDSLKKKVDSMYTDPNHVRPEDPGKLEGNIPFIYLDAFDPDKAGLEALKANYVEGGVGDSQVKKRLFEVLETFISPIRKNRQGLDMVPDEVTKMLQDGTERALARAEMVMKEVRQVMKINYF